MVTINLVPLFYIFFVGFASVDMYRLFTFTCNTFLLAFVSVLLSFVFAIPSAYIFTCKGFKTKNMIGFLVLFLSILPPFLLSILLSNLFFFLDIPNGFLALSFSHMIVIFPYTLVFMILGFSFVPTSAKYSAKIYASNTLKGFFMFYFPFMKSTFLVAFILGITISISQYVLSLMLSTPSFSTLMMQLIPYLKSADLKSANSYGIVFFINSVFAIYFIKRLKDVISKN